MPVFAGQPPTDIAAQGVRQLFIPVSHCGNGASWSALSSFPIADSNQQGPLMIWAHAGLGDSFPVSQEHKEKIFDVRIISGNDSQLKVEVASKEGSQRFNLKRDKAVSFKVNGCKFELLYPTVKVSPKDKTTTKQATIIVTKLS